MRTGPVTAPSADYAATPHPGSLIYSQPAGKRNRHDETLQHLRADEAIEDGLAGGLWADVPG